MSDAAAFAATYADWKVVKTRGVVQVVFEFPLEKEAEAYAVLGGMPRAASERWFAIAGLNVGRGDTAALVPCQPTSAGEGSLLDNDRSAAGPPPRPSPSRKLSQDVYLHYLNKPTFRVFLEQRRRHAIPTNNHINNVDEAKHVLRSWLGIESLSELDCDPAAADRWEKIEADYKTWLTAAKYVPWPGEHM